MNVDKYRILVLLSQGDKLSEIARKLGMSQPTVSFHLKSLEEGLGGAFICDGGSSCGAYGRGA